VEYAGEQHTVATRLHGAHMAVPVLGALGAALAAGVPIATALAAIARFEPIRGRMQVVRTPDGITWLRDDWKAPAWSFATPFALLADARVPRRVAIVGTVSDTTGDNSRNYRRFGQTARASADLVVFVGPHAHRGVRARATPDDASIQAFPTVRAAADWLRGELRAGDLVLLKGSHKADHLVRILLDREAPVACWRERCPITNCCSVCPDLRATSPKSSVDSQEAVSTVSESD
jgi:UDP-N-acetylmuramyl pentapeptide synthase